MASLTKQVGNTTIHRAVAQMLGFIGLRLVDMLIYRQPFSGGFAYDGSR